MTFNKTGYTRVVLSNIRYAKSYIENQNPYKAYSCLDTAERDIIELLDALERDEKEAKSGS